MTYTRQKVTKVKFKRDEPLTKQSKLVEYILEEAFEFCWSSFAEEYNTFVKSTRRNVKLNKFGCGPQHYRIYCVNIDPCHQYGVSVVESQTFLPAKPPSGEEQGETTVSQAT